MSTEPPAATTTYTSTFLGTASGFSLATDPDGGTRPVASIEITGRTMVPFTMDGGTRELEAKVRIVRAGRSYFTGEVGAESCMGWLGVGDADFDFLLRAITTRPFATVRVVSAVEINPATWNPARFEVDYFELTVS
jgi:hypothetical protein